MCEATAGWSIEQSEAWLKQAGTSLDYPGLYRAVREYRAPAPEELARAGSLPEIAQTTSVVDAMVAMDEVFEKLRQGPQNELPEQAALLWEHYRELARTEDTAKRPERYRILLTEGEQAAERLRDALRSKPALDQAQRKATLKEVAQNCVNCHRPYRNGRE
jgi:mono/diheme cytochrome c family protein